MLVDNTYEEAQIWQSSMAAQGIRGSVGTAVRTLTENLPLLC
jgi:hypothetical protein